MLDLLSLSELLSPLDVNNFWQNSFGKQPQVIAGTPEKTRRLQSLMPFETLTELMHYREGLTYKLIHRLNSYTFTPPINTRESQEQAQYLLQQGASLVMEQVDKHHAPLGKLCDQLSAEMECRTAFNLYLSYPEEAAFRLHYDTHDLFVLHLQGQKKWELFGETVPYPTDTLRHIHETIPDTVQATHTLNPGDVMYIPKGHWHRAIAQPHTEPSLHLTLGIYGATGLDLLAFLQDALEKTPDFRAPLSPLPWRSQDHSERLNTLKTQLFNYLDGEDWHRDFDSYLRHQSPRRQGLQLPYAYWKNPEQIPDQAIFSHGSLTYTLEPQGQEQWVLRYDHKYLVFAAPAVPLLRYILDTPEFDKQRIMAALPQYPWSAIKAVLLPLLQDGLCFIKS